MANYKLQIEFDKQVDLRDATNAYNRVIALIAKQIGLVNVKSIELLDTDYRTILDYRHGFALPKAIEEYQAAHIDNAKEALLEILRKTKVVTVEEEEESAKH